jgi:hypothetical protein
MNTYRITLSLSCTYEVDAINEDMAINQALEWFDEAMPTIEIDVETVETEDE